MKNIGNMTITLLTTLSVMLLIGCQKQESADPNISLLDSDTLLVEETWTSDDTTSADAENSDLFADDFDDLKLTDYDTPPVPLIHPMPVYPERLKKTGIQGVVVLEVIVLKDGSVGDARVTKSLMAGPEGLDEEALLTIRQWKFKPALYNKKSVKAKVTVPMSFSLKSVR